MESIEVTRILDQLGLQKYSSIFQENQITDKTIVLLSREDLKEIVPSIGDRAQIFQCIEAMKNGQVFSCFKCKSGSSTLQELLDHFRTEHRLTGESIYQCVHCDGLFSRQVYLRHMKNVYSLHKALFKIKSAGPVRNPDISVDSAFETDIVPENELLSKQGSHDKLQLLLGQILASILKSGKVPMSTCDNIMVNIKKFATMLIQEACIIAETIVRESKSETETVGNISSKLLSLMSLFSPFDTKYRLDKFMVGKKLMIPAKEIVLDSDITFVQRGSTQRQVYKPISMQYIPIKKSLKQLLQKPGFFNSLDRSNIYNAEYYTKFRDGKICSEFEFPQNTIFLNLYYDEAEMANPLGSKSGKHKLSNFYFSILDMPQHMQSSTDNVILLASIKSEDFKSSSANSVMQIIIDEFKELWADGIDFMMNNVKFNVKVCLAQISGDNLGLHALLGFSEGFTANFPCRRCKMHKTECHTAISEDKQKLRDANNYNADLAIGDLSKTGINCESVANQLPYFHVTKNCVFDIMHDVLEGVVPDFMVHCINAFIRKKLFTLDMFNSRLESFNYGRHFKNTKPSLIKMTHLKADTKIGQNAAQNLCLALCFGLLIGDLVPSTDGIWELYLLLNELLTIILADKITKGGLVNFQNIVAEYCFTYQKVFKRTLKPKHHHLIHYASAIEQIGPLKHFWSMTFESKHNFFKTTAHSTCNYKNISKSLAYRHQLARAFKLLSIDEFNPQSFDVISYENVMVSSLPQPEIICDHYFKTSEDEIVVSDLVSHNGCEYRPGCFLLLSFCETSPTLGEIQSIILENDDCRFLVKLFCGNFESSKGCYKIEDTNSFKIVDINDICYYLPMYSMTSFTFNDINRYVILPVKYV